MRGASWIENVEAAGVLAVAQALGLERVRPLGRGLKPCPACGADVRGVSSRDPRGPVGLTRDLGGWECHRCHAKGGAVQLAAAGRYGETLRADDPRWRELREWCESAGLARTDEQGPRKARNQRGDPARHVESGPVERFPEREPAPMRPPIDGVARLWSACGPVLDHEQVIEWLRGRALDPCAIEERDLARALPCDLTLPPWASLRGPWWANGYQLLLGMFGPSGALESVHARNLRADLSEDWPKGASPAGFEIRGLVFADRLGVDMLATGSVPHWWPAAESFRVFVAEGLPDFLTAATFWGDSAETAPAVLGIVSGSWSPEIAARIPAGTVVTVCTHRDEAGDKYAARVHGSLHRRCIILRHRLGGAA